MAWMSTLLVGGVLILAGFGAGLVLGVVSGIRPTAFLEPGRVIAYSAPTVGIRTCAR